MQLSPLKDTMIVQNKTNKQGNAKQKSNKNKKKQNKTTATTKIKHQLKKDTALYLLGVKNKNKQDMTVPFARARAKLGESFRLSAVTILIAWWCFRSRLLIVKHTLLHLTSVNIDLEDIIVPNLIQWFFWQNLKAIWHD